jgi:general secretion pathway protein M
MNVTARRSQLPPALAAWQDTLRARWVAMAPRERRLIGACLSVVLLFAVWLLLVAPALRTMREAPARIDQLDLQLQHMQRLAAEGRELKNITPMSAAQAAIVLKAATDRLGDQAKLSLQGERAVLALNGVSGEQLRSWLAEARSGARARPLEAQLSRNAQGAYNGTMVVSLGGSAP